jgi:hypothetical protein
MSWRWKKAVDVPKSWEGRQAWRWNDWEGSGLQRQPYLDFIPHRFSREINHCRGVWFKRMEIPKPPRER